jgi:hypothetical protein
MAAVRAGMGVVKNIYPQSDKLMSEGRMLDGTGQPHQMSGVESLTEKILLKCEQAGMAIGYNRRESSGKSAPWN